MTYLEFLNKVRNNQEVIYRGEVFRVILGPSRSPVLTVIKSTNRSEWCYYLESEYNNKRIAIDRINYYNIELLEDEDNIKTYKVVDEEITGIPYNYEINLSSIKGDYYYDNTIQ